MSSVLASVKTILKNNFVSSQFYDPILYFDTHTTLADLLAHLSTFDDQPFGQGSTGLSSTWGNPKCPPLQKAKIMFLTDKSTFCAGSGINKRIPSPASCLLPCPKGWSYNKYVTDVSSIFLLGVFDMWC
jgi:hypothetical protein